MSNGMVLDVKTLETLAESSIKIAFAALKRAVDERDAARREAEGLREQAARAFALGVRWEANRCTPEDIEEARKELERPEVRAYLEQLGDLERVEKPR